MSNGRGTPEERLAELEATMRRIEVERQRFLAGLGFDWKSSPHIDHGLMREHPMVPPPSLRIVLCGGRQIELRALHQYYAHGGVLCGLPPTPESDFESAFVLAKRVFPNFGERARLLEPVLHTGYMRVDEAGKPSPFTATWVPPAGSIGLFESDPLTHAADDAYSSGVLIWFQEANGLPSDPRTLDQMANVDWDAVAVGWTP